MDQFGSRVYNNGENGVSFVQWCDIVLKPSEFSPSHDTTKSVLVSVISAKDVYVQTQIPLCQAAVILSDLAFVREQQDTTYGGTAVLTMNVTSELIDVREGVEAVYGVNLHPSIHSARGTQIVIPLGTPNNETAENVVVDLAGQYHTLFQGTSHHHPHHVSRMYGTVIQNALFQLSSERDPARMRQRFQIILWLTYAFRAYIKLHPDAMQVISPLIDSSVARDTIQRALAYALTGQTIPKAVKIEMVARALSRTYNHKSKTLNLAANPPTGTFSFLFLVPLLFQDSRSISDRLDQWDRIYQELDRQLQEQLEFTHVGRNAILHNHASVIYITLAKAGIHEFTYDHAIALVTAAQNNMHFCPYAHSIIQRPNVPIRMSTQNLTVANKPVRIGMNIVPTTAKNDVLCQSIDPSYVSGVQIVEFGTYRIVPDRKSSGHEHELWVVANQEYFNESAARCNGASLYVVYSPEGLMCSEKSIRRSFWMWARQNWATAKKDMLLIEQTFPGLVLCIFSQWCSFHVIKID